MDYVEIQRDVDHAATIEVHAADGTLLDMVLPNGKRLRDCTGEEVGAVGARMAEIGELLAKRRKPLVRVKAISRAA
jgi:hypothetical protein